MNPEDAENAILRELKKVTDAYGAKRVNPGVIGECVQIMLEKFSNFGIEEIRHAYRAWAARETQGMEMYGGDFTATQFTRVMTDWQERRRKILNEYLMLKEISKAKIEAKERAEKYDFMEDLASHNPANWKESLEYFYVGLLSRGLIEITADRKAEIKADAKRQAKREIDHDKGIVHKTVFPKGGEYKQDERLAWLEDQLTSGNREDLIYRKMVVFEYIKNR